MAGIARGYGYTVAERDPPDHDTDAEAITLVVSVAPAA
jgi:hypothetical protein